MNYLNKEIVIVGLGYVGLPLAIKLSSHFSIIGYDISEKRINELNKNYDNTKEIKKNTLSRSKNIKFTFDKSNIDNKYFYIVTVPTPVKKDNTPDLSLLNRACRLVGKAINKGAIIVFESTV